MDNEIQGIDPDERFMRIALGLAELGRGFTAPNPMVGAVIVRKGRIVGAGYHKKAGEPHAEIRAMEDAGWDVKGATMYVTLEPCVHYGRTPPCTDRIIKERIKRVVIAVLDPNPRVHGEGVRKLREAGIEVKVGVLEREARALNEAFFKFMETGLPFVILKLAVTLDGHIADSRGNSKWISSDAARAFVHKLRGEMDGIAVGINTVLMDDPMLTPREVHPARVPRRFVLDSGLKIPLTSKVLDVPPPTVIVSGTNHDRERKKALEERGIEVWVQERAAVDIEAFLRRAGEEGIQSIMFEGGGKVATSIIGTGLFDKIYLFLSPKLLGGGIPFFRKEPPLPIDSPVSLEIETFKRFSSDLLMVLRKKG